jgi:replicative DNA helicase
MSKSGLPPFNLEAEAAVLSAAALDDTGEILDTVRGIVSAGAFYKRENRDMFETMCRLSDAGKPTDVITIWNQLRADGRAQSINVDYVREIIDATPAVPNAPAHAQIVQDCFLMRSAIEESRLTVTKLLDMDGADTQQVHELLQQSEQRLSDLAYDRTQSKLRPVSDVFRDVQTQLAKAFDQHNAVTGIPTGFKRIDSMMTGLQDGDVTIVAARPGMGKTAFALAMALHIAGEGYGVAFFSLEMPAEQLALRLLSVKTGIELNKLRTGRFDPGVWTSITDSMQELSTLPIYIDDTPAITILEVRARVKRLQRELEAGRHLGCNKRRLGVVEIDYLQLMGVPKDSRSREQEVSLISRSCKAHAKQLKVPYVPLSQLNRDPEKRTDKQPQLSDLRESGSLEQDADNVLFIHRPSYYKPDDPELCGWANVIVAKQRNGPTGSVKLAFKKECTRFANMAEEYDDNDEYFDGLPSGQDSFDWEYDQ